MQQIFSELKGLQSPDQAASTHQSGSSQTSEKSTLPKIQTTIEQQPEDFQKLQKAFLAALRELLDHYNEEDETPYPSQIIQYDNQSDTQSLYEPKILRKHELQSTNWNTKETPAVYPAVQQSHQKIAQNEQQRTILIDISHLTSQSDKENRQSNSKPLSRNKGGLKASKSGVFPYQIKQQANQMKRSLSQEKSINGSSKKKIFNQTQTSIRDLLERHHIKEYVKDVSLDPATNNNHQWVSNDGSNPCELSFSESRACSCKNCSKLLSRNVTQPCSKTTRNQHNEVYFTSSSDLNGSKRYGKAYPLNSSGVSNGSISGYKYEYTSVSGFNTGEALRSNSKIMFEKRRNNCIR